MKKIIILASALTLALSSCDSWLDKEPLSKMSQFDYFRDATDLELFSNPFYNNLLDKEPYDQQSDCFIQANLSSEMTGGNKRIVPAAGGGWSWSDLRRMNTLLTMAPQQCQDEKALVKYSAVTRFFRAYFYFEKVKRFGDVPWYETELGSDDPALYNPRDSREFIMTKMLEDIDYAINCGGLTEKATPYRVNRWAALALKARFCLYEGTFRKYHNLQVEGHDAKYYLDLAAEAAREIIEKSPYKLYSTGKPESDYLMLFAREDASTDEYILSIKFDAGVGAYHNATGFSLFESQGRVGLTRKFVNTYLMKDGSRFTDIAGWQEKGFLEETRNRDPRMAQTMRTPGYTRIGQSKVLPPDYGVAITGYQPVKFVQNPSDNNGDVDRVNRSTCDMPVFRLGEVMLNFAEAKAEAGTLTQQDLDISVNKLRDRVGMPHLNMDEANANPDWYLSSEEYGYQNVTGANKGVILEIRRERAIELFEEGFRFQDLVRWREGACIDQRISGVFFPSAGEYDLSGDGKADLILYNEGEAKPSAGEGVQVYELNKELILSNGNKGFVYYHKNVERTKFNQERDYLYPIPINERTLNPNLKQNPGWNDGLSF